MLKKFIKRSSRNATKRPLTSKTRTCQPKTKKPKKMKLQAPRMTKVLSLKTKLSLWTRGFLKSMMLY